ncbi:MAG: hypothetical protein RR598_04405 [Anaerorhabdus sp.]
MKRQREKFVFEIYQYKGDEEILKDFENFLYENDFKISKAYSIDWIVYEITNIKNRSQMEYVFKEVDIRLKQYSSYMRICPQTIQEVCNHNGDPDQ